VADEFVARVKLSSVNYNRTDIVFDRYRDDSIKASTHPRGTKTIRRVIEHRGVPLPVSWSNFTALPENKADMALFLSIMELMGQAPEDKMFVTGGRFLDEQDVRSNEQLHSMKMLRATHEEADTILILHGIHSDPDTCCQGERHRCTFT